ncbi:hypothetical protein GCM10009639_18660 [Kitasatospora putterlickiae]|uniref:Uncharacterized protein n=1 Tax=Kitasatospora putterlickiae TaxID=221725 RepID=A0ABP4IKW9_9ACTN
MGVPCTTALVTSSLMSNCPASMKRSPPGALASNRSSNRRASPGERLLRGSQAEKEEGEELQGDMADSPSRHGELKAWCCHGTAEWGHRNARRPAA